MSIANEATAAVIAANKWAEEANETARAGAAAGRPERRVAGLSAWEWAEQAEQAARRAGNYASAAAGAASAHDIPEAKRRLANARSEASSAGACARHAAYAVQG
jgi:hypothetical protein